LLTKGKLTPGFQEKLLKISKLQDESQYYTVVIFVSLISNNAKAQLHFSKPFKECKQTGSFTHYDLKNKKLISSDLKDSQKPSLPTCFPKTSKIMTLFSIDEILLDIFKSISVLANYTK